MAIVKPDPDHKMAFLDGAFGYRDDEPVEQMPASSPLRIPVADFALQMEYKLRKNDHKKGWRELPVQALEKLMAIEIEEYKVAREFFEASEARAELVDIANFCMMLYDRLGMKDETPVST